MTIAALLLLPAASGALSFWVPSRLARRALLVAVALMHLGLTLFLWSNRPEPTAGSWLAVDTPGLLFLTIASVLFLASAIYCLGYLSHEEAAHRADRTELFLFSNEPEAVFIGCLLLFLASMTLVTLSQHFGLLWVGVEATTLASAPLIYFHRDHRSLEATWKYLLICSVGIALALMGNFVLAVSAASVQTHDVSLHVTSLLGNASKLDSVWLKATFLFFLVGYGTKMGLAPMHTWLPDAHSEAPSSVSALLSGALLNCAFLGIFRVHQLCTSAGEGEFTRSLLVVFGLMSMGVAAVFILRARDFKRMLAYSSVEHMGILALGVGLGGAGVLGAMFHAFNHSFTKAALFLAAGNILLVYGTKSIKDVRGIQRRLPVTGALWLAGFLAITGTPPFGTFISEFTILKAALDADRALVATLYMALLAIIFIGMANIMLKMSQGTVPQGTRNSSKDGVLSVGPSLVLASLVLLFGFYVPKPLRQAFDEVTLSVSEEMDSPDVSVTIASLQAKKEAQTIRAIALELERLACHTGDLGALAQDIGFQPTAAFCGRLRGDFLNATALLCGNRFGRSLVQPGGVRWDISREFTVLLKCLLRPGIPVTHLPDRTCVGSKFSGQRDSFLNSSGRFPAVQSRPMLDRFSQIRLLCHSPKAGAAKSVM